MRCIVIDDESNARDVIKRYIERVPFLEFVEEFQNPTTAMNFLEHHSIDLIFLDINMPEVTGVEFIKSIINPPSIIFTTAYKEYALEGFENDVADYLLKPIRFERFLKAINKLKRLESIRIENDYVMVKSGHSFHKILIDEILFLQKDSNYIEIHTTDKKRTLIRENMNNIFSIFSEVLFIRVHKSYVVASKHISIIEAHQITLSNNQKIPLGASYRENLMKQFKYLK